MLHCDRYFAYVLVYLGKRLGQVIEYGIHTNMVSSVMMIQMTAMSRVRQQS